MTATRSRRNSRAVATAASIAQHVIDEGIGIGLVASIPPLKVMAKALRAQLLALTPTARAVEEPDRRDTPDLDRPPDEPAQHGERHTCISEPS